ncbi:MAG TPA: hypothetical protein DCZ91_23855 [Lachnospiraceae bacterium]|nr:hypothetical protein [Lachnospiraceae bacterium]
MKDLNEARQFGSYINKLRKKRGFRLDQASEGLCTEQMLSFLENGKRAAPKLLQDALLERLGVGAEDYEYYLHYKEYDRWEARQRILHCITYELAERAVQLLEQYRITYITEDEEGDLNVSVRLEKQFYFSMLAQIRRCEGADRAELYSILEKAVRLTVPMLWCKPLKEMSLSIKELNLILEAEQYRESGGEQGHYQEVIVYIESVGLDGVGMAKIYPKAVYFLCRYLSGSGSGKRIQEEVAGRSSENTDLLICCNRAVECLRDNSRMYYLWELLDIRERLLKRIEEELSQKGETKKAETLEPMRRENKEWMKTLESVYAEYGVPKETFSYTCLYVEKGAACISDVIRIRRNMLGMSREELCEGICDVKTLRRLENRKTVSRREIVEELFERLGLSRELTRTELETEKPEARQLMEKLRTCINDHRMEEAEEMYARIKELVSMKKRCNRQTLMQVHIILRNWRGDLSDAECYREICIALELTIPYKAFLKEGEKYLTYEEQSCIQNMMQRMDKTSSEFLTCMRRFEELYQPFEMNLLIGTVSSIYELIMEFVGSEWGNLGIYDKADKVSGIIVKECLCFRRLHSISAGLYDRWWNYAERKQRGIPTDKILNGEEELTKCLILSTLDKQKHYEPFYQKKLESARKKQL